MRNFPSAKLLFFLAFAAMLSSYAGNKDEIDAPDPARKWNPVFDSSFSKGLYKATMDIGKNHLTGFIFVKKISDTSYRVLFNNEIGMTYFDLEFFPGVFVVHSCFPSMDRKSLLKLLGNDFGILFFTDHGIRKIVQVKHDVRGERSYKMTSGTGRWQLRAADPLNSLIFIGSLHKFISRTRIQLDHSGGSAAGITISNPMLRLTITLKMISP